MALFFFFFPLYLLCDLYDIRCPKGRVGLVLIFCLVNTIIKRIKEQFLGQNILNLKQSISYFSYLNTPNTGTLTMDRRVIHEKRVKSAQNADIDTLARVGFLPPRLCSPFVLVIYSNPLHFPTDFQLFFAEFSLPFNNTRFICCCSFHRFMFPSVV